MLQCALNFALKYYFIPFSPLYFVHSFDAVFARIDSFFSGLCWLETRKEVVYNQPFLGENNATFSNEPQNATMLVNSLKAREESLNLQ